MELVNKSVLFHPVNWLVVGSMVAIGGYAAHLILTKWQPGLMTVGPIQVNFGQTSAIPQQS